MHRKLVGSSARIAAFLCLTLMASGALAAQPEDCPTWFPDLRCDREGRYEGFHKPIVMPYLFEDPFITTGIYPVYIWHDFGDPSAMGGGHASVFALQARVALTDRLAFIATKDGYMWNRPENPLLEETQGFVNIAAGLKYALIDMPEKNFMLSPALRFELPTGSTDTLSGHADGVVIPSVSAAWGTGDLRLMAGLGSEIPFDMGQQSTSLFYHLYGSYQLTERFSPFVQLSGISWLSSGDGKIPVPLKAGGSLPLNTVQDALNLGRFEGADVFNLGSRGVAGQDLYTWAIGAHLPVGPGRTLSAAYERTFSHQKGLFQQRITTSLTLEF